MEKKESTALSGYLFKLNCCHGKLLIPCWPITLMHSVRLYPLITYQDICQNVQSSVILVSFMINTEYSNSASDLITLILKQVYASCSQNVFCFFFYFGIRLFPTLSHSSAINNLKGSSLPPGPEHPKLTHGTPAKIVLLWAPESDISVWSVSWIYSRQSYV